MMDSFDQNLVTKLEAIRQEADELRASLYQRHGNCACSDGGLCAFHAVMNNFLHDISYTAKVAQANLGHEWGRDLPFTGQSVG